MPTLTDDTNRWFNVIERAYYVNGSTTVTTPTYNATSTQYWNVLDQSHRQTGGTSLVANSPYVIDDWRAWNTSNCTTTYTQNIYYGANDTWREWCTTPSVYTNGIYQGNGVPPEPTPEELAAQKVAQEKRARAQVRARSLLDSVLTPEQRQYMERHGYIPVVGSKGRRYHIRTTGGASGNVALVDDSDKVTGRFCAHPTSAHGYIPTEDSFVAQLLHLQDDEDDFLGRANLVEGKNPVRRAILSAA
jgi:hypothetical protein